MISPIRLTGVVSGKSIILQDDTGMSDGEEVTITIEPRHNPSPNSDEARESLQRAAGAWAGDDEEGLAEYLEWNRQQRKIGRSELTE